MKTKTFFDLDQAESYLRNSIIRYKGLPYTIVGVGRSKEQPGSFAMSLLRLGGTDQVTAQINDPDVDMNPVPLGFVNIKLDSSTSIAVKTLRYPARAWKVGLSRTTLGWHHLHRDDPGISPDSLINSVWLSNTIEGKFPSLEETTQLVAKSGPYGSTAFHRKFAIRGTRLHHLLHSNSIGTIKDGHIKLNPPFEFLRESVDRAIQS